MLNLLFLIPALPFAGFLILAVIGRRLAKRTVALVGAGSVGLSAILSIVVAAAYLAEGPRLHAFIQTFWTWMEFGNYAAAVSLYLDPLSLVMMLVITIVGFLIHLYSTEFMADEEGYSRFFAYMNLFVGSMLTLVLADNFLLLYFGWEGVGLCSYLLIGFWYKDPANGVAARKAFFVTRVGDTAFALGLFLLFTNLGTLNIQEVTHAAVRQWPAGSTLAVFAAALLLGGAVGKSAQMPLQVWLPDAMAGPTPVSALIHAATMVTAGVYLIARAHVLFELAPPVQAAVAVIGAATLLLAGCSALVQRDIKRVLAYSTISQIGYMFLALGIGAWSAALFHFMTHAFFKALLFLAAGGVIIAQHHEHDMFRMGGLWKRIPGVFWTFLIGACSLSALPFVTAGFYSKDLILARTLASPLQGFWLWTAGIAGAFLTSLYTFRMVIITFFGSPKNEITYVPRIPMGAALVVLALLSIIGGFIDVPHMLLPVFGAVPEVRSEAMSSTVASLASLAGILAASAVFFRRPAFTEELMGTGVSKVLARFWFSGWGFDRVYDFMLVRPFLWIAKANKSDLIDKAYAGLAAIGREAHDMLSLVQNGNIRWYAMALAFGAVVFAWIVIFMTP